MLSITRFASPSWLAGYVSISNLPSDFSSTYFLIFSAAILAGLSCGNWPANLSVIGLSAVTPFLSPDVDVCEDEPPHPERANVEAKNKLSSYQMGLFRTE